jgi:preprotein translocase subunit SecA
VVFEQRREFMADASVSTTIQDMRHGVIDDLVVRHIPEGAYPEQWDIEGLGQDVTRTLNLELPVAEWAAEEGIFGDGDKIIFCSVGAGLTFAGGLLEW